MQNWNWVEELYQENYERLFAIGMTVVSKNPIQMQMLEDAIQETFYELIKKEKKLRNHPTIEAWLIVTLRLKLKEQFKKQLRDEKWNEFSFDSANDVLATNKAEMSQDQRDGLRIILEKEQIKQLENLLGEENAKLFIMYCVNREPTRIVAQEFGLSENALWVRINRLRKRILDNQDIFLSIAIIFLGKV